MIGYYKLNGFSFWSFFTPTLSPSFPENSRNFWVPKLTFHSKMVKVPINKVPVSDPMSKPDMSKESHAEPVTEETGIRGRLPVTTAGKAKSPVTTTLKPAKEPANRPVDPEPLPEGYQAANVAGFADLFSGDDTKDKATGETTEEVEVEEVVKVNTNRYYCSSDTYIPVLGNIAFQERVDYLYYIPIRDPNQAI